MQSNGHKHRTRFELPGLSVDFRVAEPGYEVADSVVGPGFAATPHVHLVHHEMFLVVEGTIDFLVGDETMRMEAGSFVDVPVGVVHDFHNPGPEAARLVGIATPGGLSGYFASVEDHVRAGTFDIDVLTALRAKHDTESVHVVWRVATADR